MDTKIPLEMLQQTRLFCEFHPAEVRAALTALSAETESFSKDALILAAGRACPRFALVLKGSVHIERNDIWGNRSLLSRVGQGQFFAETYAILYPEPLLVDVRAAEYCSILFFHLGGLAALRQHKGAWVTPFLSNLLLISAHKNLHLSGRSFHTAAKTIRERLLAYLDILALQKNCREFDIPFDRQGLADYLNVDRSALSKEIGKMRDQGLLQAHKSHFILGPASTGSNSVK